MLAQLPSEVAHHLHIPKFFQGYADITDSRPRLESSSSYDSLPRIVSRSDPRIHPPPGSVDHHGVSPPTTPPGVKTNYAHRGSVASSEAPNTPNPSDNNNMYESSPQTNSYPSPLTGYTPTTPPQDSFHNTVGLHRALSPGASDGRAVTSRRDTDNPGAYPPDSPSPAHSQDSAGGQSYSDVDRFPTIISAASDRLMRSQSHQNPVLERDSYSTPSMMDHRRLSEPNTWGNTSYSSFNESPGSRQVHFPPPYSAPPHSARSSFSYGHYPMPRGSVAMRDAHEQHRQTVYTGQQHFKQEPDSLQSLSEGRALDDLSGGHLASTLELPVLHFPPLAEDPYSSSPPGTSGSSTGQSVGDAHQGTSATSSATPRGSAAPARGPHADSNGKTYSFVSLPGNAVKKRPRRRYDEIERLYQCSWPDCTKAYGTLNHLNAHVTMQKHGLKRSPDEFKELRKQWRKSKKEMQDARAGVRRLTPNRECDSGYHGDEQHFQRLHHGPIGLHPSLSMPSLPSLATRYPSSYGLSLCDSRYASMDDLTLQQRQGRVAYAQQQQQQQQQQHQQHQHQHQQGCTPSSWPPTVSMYRPTSNYGGGGGAALPMHMLDAAAMSPPPSSSSSATTTTTTTTQLSPSAGGVHLGRLPPDSTLLTPLPGYEPPSLLPPLQGDVSMDGYDGYPHHHQQQQQQQAYERAAYGRDGRAVAEHAGLGGR